MGPRVILLAVLSLGACERTPEPNGSEAPSDSSQSAPTAATTEASGESGSNAADANGAPSCMVPLAEPPPPPATSLESCPADPERPVMPIGTVLFDEGEKTTSGGAPTIQVELAQTDAHRAHGLMFRPTLTDDEGMLFSWPREAPRSFWMKNTCLALDMLFIDEQGFIVGILEQVPPWNEASRRVSCPAAHVLEVRAGFTRDHGITPGQHVTIRP